MTWAEALEWFDGPSGRWPITGAVVALCIVVLVLDARGGRRGVR